MTKYHFLQFPKCPKMNFWIWKKLKTAKSAIWRKKIGVYLISRVFLVGIFKFSGRLCEENSCSSFLKPILGLSTATGPIRVHENQISSTLLFWEFYWMAPNPSMWMNLISFHTYHFNMTWLKPPFDINLGAFDYND